MQFSRAASLFLVFAAFCLAVLGSPVAKRADTPESVLTTLQASTAQILPQFSECLPQRGENETPLRRVLLPTPRPHSSARR